MIFGDCSREGDSPDSQKETRKLEFGMLAVITRLIYFSKLPKGTKSTGGGESREGLKPSKTHISIHSGD